MEGRELGKDGEWREKMRALLLRKGKKEVDRREGREEEGICRTNVKLLPTPLKHSKTCLQTFQKERARLEDRKWLFFLDKPLLLLLTTSGQRLLKRFCVLFYMLPPMPNKFKPCAIVPNFF